MGDEEPNVIKLKIIKTRRILRDLRSYVKLIQLSKTHETHGWFVSWLTGPIGNLELQMSGDRFPPERSDVRVG